MFLLSMLAAGAHAQSSEACIDTVWTDAGAAARTDFSPVYILVMDYSGSMEARDGEKNTRWQRMQARAQKVLQELPLGTQVTLYIFRGCPAQGAPECDSSLYSLPVSLATEADRTEAQRWLSEFTEPMGITPLYDTMDMVFGEAETISNLAPGRQVRVMIYTDGDDEGSRLGPGDVERRFGDVYTINPNFYVFEIPLNPKEMRPRLGLEHPNYSVGNAAFPVPVSLALVNDTLFHPTSAGKGTQTLNFCVDIPMVQMRPELEALEAALEFTSEDGLNARLSPAAIPLSQGGLPVEITVASPQTLDPGREYRGTITVTPPEGEGLDLQLAPVIFAIRFAPVQLKIAEVRPPAGSIFLARRDIGFSVDTHPDAQVLWDFGNNTTASGHKVRHAFPAAQDVVVKLQASRGSETITEEIPLEILDLAVAINPVETAFVGRPVELEATIRGEGITGVEWVVGGNTIPGSGEKGTRLREIFPTGGEKHITARLIHPRFSLQASRMVRVIPAPALRLLSPVSGETLLYDQALEFVAATEGPVDQVIWKVTSPETNTVLVGDREIPVLDGKSTLPVRIPGDRFNGQDATIRVEALGMLGSQVPQDVQRPRQELTARAAYAPPDVALEIEGTPEFGQPVVLKVEPEDQVRSVQWDVGKGEPFTGGASTQVVYDERAGDFTVVADVEGAGGKRTRLTRGLTITAVPPQAKFALRVSGEDNPAEAEAGSQVRLLDQSEGTIATRRWLVNGEEVSAEEAAFELQLGENQVELVVAGPPAGAGATPPSSSIAMKITGTAPLPYLLLIPVWLISLLILGALALLYTGNGHMNWVVKGWPQGPEGRYLSVHPGKRKFYRRWRKEAVIPAKEVLPGIPFYNSGEGAGDVLVLYGRYQDPLSHSQQTIHGRNPKVSLVQQSATSLKNEYVLTDRRFEEGVQTFRIEVDRSKGNDKGDLLKLLVFAGIILAANAALYFYAHQAATVLANLTAAIGIG